MKSYNLNFIGYIQEGLLNKFIPRNSGIYCVHAHNRNSLLFDNSTRLLYIGKANNLNERLNLNHECYNAWKSALRVNETLQFSYAIINEKEETLFRIESALIYENQPLVNELSKKSFNLEDTIVYCNGTIGTLKPMIIVRRNSQKAS